MICTCLPFLCPSFLLFSISPLQAPVGSDVVSHLLTLNLPCSAAAITFDSKMAELATKLTPEDGVTASLDLELYSRHSICCVDCSNANGMFILCIFLCRATSWLPLNHRKCSDLGSAVERAIPAPECEQVGGLVPLENQCCIVCTVDEERFRKTNI